MTRRWRVALIWGVVVGVAGGLGFLAGRWTIAAPELPQEASPSSAYIVEEATVERSSTHRIKLEWDQQPIAYAATGGTVTSIETSSGEVAESGDILFRVDGRPVVIAGGETPAYRTLSQGSTGDDVAQLQELLRSKGYLSANADGKFGAQTTAAVKRWQRDLGVKVSGDVPLGDVVFSPTLPARIVLRENIVQGQRITEGDKTVDVISAEPRFELEIDSNSAVPEADTPVIVTFEDFEWDGVIGGAVAPQDDQGRTLLQITGPGDGLLCGTECSKLPLNPAPGKITARVEQVPATTGPSVPISALGQLPTGDYFVETPEGEKIPVDVIVTDGSRAIVDGLDAGQVISLFSGEPSPPDESDS